jgi:single-strand DNA-binding protein
MGRLVKDPDLRHTNGGTPVASFTLACDRDYKDKSTGEKGTDFIDVVVWRQTAEFVHSYFAKGRMAIVEGRLTFRDWTDKDGNKRRNAEITAENVYFGDSKTQQSEQSYAPKATYGEKQQMYNKFQELNDDDGYLPF